MENQPPIHKPIIYSLSSLDENNSIPEFSNALVGFRILSINVSQQANLISSPVENGIRIVDNKVRMPIKIQITGICDNLRGPQILSENKKESTQDILTLAKNVYAEIDAMLNETESELTESGTRPKTYTIATKGVVYRNMILTNVSQVNDAEHLLVIPATLTFTELMFLDEEGSQAKFLPDDENVRMSGALKVDGIYQI